MKKTNNESEAYNSGWLAGYDALVADLYNAFDGKLPTWLLEVMDGKKAVTSALKSKPQDDDFMFDSDYDDGETDGFDELLEDVVEAFKEKEIEMPMFLKQIVGDADPPKPSGALGL